MKVNLHVLLFFGLIIGCTRSLPGVGLSVGLGGGAGQGGLAADDQLVKTISVVNLANRPSIVRETVYKKGEVPRGQDLRIDLERIPVGTPFLVQFLAIYENTNSGATRYFYGSNQGVASAATVIEIMADNVAETDKMIRVAGRYGNSAGSPVNGNLTVEFLPPHNEPPIFISADVVVDGWFSVTVADSQAAQFRVRINGGEFLPQLRSGADEISHFGNQLLKIVKPLSFHSDSSGQTRPSAEADIYLGVWGEPLAQVCYPDSYQVVAGEFANPGLDIPLEYSVSAPTPLSVRPAGGGVMISGNSSACALVFDPERVTLPSPFYH